MLHWPCMQPACQPYTLNAGLYKGVMLSGAVVVPYLAVSFSVYDHLRAQLSDSRQSRGTWWHPLAKVGMGATAGVVAQASVLSTSDLCCRSCMPSPDWLTSSLHFSCAELLSHSTLAWPHLASMWLSSSPT